MLRNDAAEAKPEKPSESTMEFISSMSAVLVTGLFIITFIVQAFEIPSKSMVKTLLVGDHLFVDRLAFAPPTSWARWFTPYRSIKRGDIAGQRFQFFQSVRNGESEYSCLRASQAAQMRAAREVLTKFVRH